MLRGNCAVIAVYYGSKQQRKLCHCANRPHAESGRTRDTTSEHCKQASLIEMRKNPHCSGSVLFGCKMSVLLHCKIAYTTEENVVLLC